MRLIDADELWNDLGILYAYNKGRVNWNDAIMKIKYAPTVEERKTGKWIYGEDEYGIDGYHCNQCGFFVPWDYVHKFINYIEDYHYCPNCGARMEE